MSDYIKREDAIFVTLQQPLYSVVSQIKQLESIDIVRCKECVHCYVDGEQVKFNACELNHNKVQNDDWFCADGEREGE